MPNFKLYTINKRPSQNDERKLFIKSFLSNKLSTATVVVFIFSY